MRIIAFFLSALFVNSAVAEPKKLVCDIPAESEIAKWTQQLNDDWFRKHMPEFITKYEANLQRCKDNREYGRRNVYTFDTRGLSNTQFSTAEELRSTCAGDTNFEGITVASKLSATPSVISFISQKGFFNIDRKTLNAGYGSERDYKCVLEDIDLSGNLL